MKASRLAIAALLSSVAAFGAAASEADFYKVPFQGTLTRAEVRAEFLASRAQTAALTGEDSGSAYLSANKAANGAGTRLAGTPARAQ